ncbi:rhodanese-like domain-containing protein [Aquitalea palustris]|uniref:Rhodanese-like domain-containing protein n=1 Tax=Aquitalea palustris TaxID=2480983 RepID=A0A454JD01_9NEIS|nr:rhodanese-like domain-containing protein [Aquitalea palustris]RMC90931.1 rhodanese-like domain-containing protein [Aquitalea palustris]
MDQSDLILQTAAERAAAQQLPYQGALTPPEAHFLAQHLPGAVLVDVRSAAEWQFVGVVPGALRIELRSFPGMQLNAQFVEQLQAAVDKQAVLLLMCRSGVRSHEAATQARAAGYARVYNVLEGFEGDKDEHEHRGQLTGWKAHGLPWVQG